MSNDEAEDKDAALLRPVGAARQAYQLRRQHGRERHFTVDSLLNDIFYSGADF